VIEDHPDFHEGFPTRSWQRADLDFPVLMLKTSPWPPFVSSFGGSPFVGLCDIGVSYGDSAERLHLRTVARRGRRMGPHGPQWVLDDLAGLAGEAARNLLLSTIEHGTQPEATHQRVQEYLERGQRLAQQFLRPPWQVRSVPVDGVEFAMWFTALPEGFAAALDYGPIVLTAWGQDPDEWDWRMTAVPPEATWPLIEAFDD
jgi:hypothetical protein